MNPFDYGRSQRKADDMIRRRGGTGKLRREGSADRGCSCVVIEYTPRERGLVNDGARRALVSALDPATRAPLATPPDHMLDRVVFAGEVLRIVAPDRGPRPSGVVVFHDLEVRYDSRDV